jgi:hypothetical protein
MYKISVAVLEEDEAVALVLERCANKFDAFRLQFCVGLIEVLNRNRNMSHSGRARVRILGDTFRSDDFDHAPIFRPYEVVSLILVILVKLESLDVPIRKSLGVGRRNREMFDAREHKNGVYQGLAKQTCAAR